MTDRDDIVELTIRYATVIDSKQYALLQDVFTDDAVVEIGRAHV